ncbi:MAG: nucleotidyltransferase family protein [Actinomycetota bacterium]|nr:nucleotidyltransferase family protein [Actinomycetota bacterium]
MAGCGIVLGAGASRRLGRPKQSLPFGDTTVLGWVVRDLEASVLDRVVVVVGGGAEEARAGLTVSRAEVVSNDAYASGCSSSLQAGLDAAGDCEAVVLVLGDMPGVDAGVVDAVWHGWARERPWATVTSYRGEPGHPFVFSAAAFPTLRGLHGDKAVWRILDTEGHRVARVAIDRPLPLDVDTWDDYQEVCRQFGFAPDPGERASPARRVEGPPQVDEQSRASGRREPELDRGGRSAAGGVGEDSARLRHARR